MSFQHKTKSKMMLDEEENKKRIEESEARAQERIYGDKMGLPWPPEEHEEEWQVDRQRIIDECKQALKKVFKPIPDKPVLKKPPPIDREAARDKAKKILAKTDAFDEYEKRMDKSK